MDLTELESFERSKGFKSYGRECDEFYNSIIPENFTSNEEMLKFVEENNKYIQMIIEENGDTSIATRYDNSPYRYIINEEKMYQVKNSVFKVFSEGIVSTSIKNIEELRNCSEDNIIDLQKNPEFHFMQNSSKLLLKSTEAYCGDKKEDFQQNGNNRTVIKIWAEEHYTFDPLGAPWGSHIKFHYKTYPQKRTWGAWFGCTRTITAHFDATLYYSSREKRFTKSYYGVSASKIESSLVDWDYDFGPLYGTGWFNVNFKSYNCSFDTPSTSPVTISCN